MITNIIEQLKEVYSGSEQHYLKARPNSHVRVTHGDRWIFASKDEYLQAYDKRKGARTFNRKQQLVRSNEYRKELIWLANKIGLKLSVGDYMIVFMKHMPNSWKKGIRKPGKRDTMAWKPMRSRPDIDNFFKKLADSLLKEDNVIWCTGLIKIWIPDEIEEGTYFINMPCIFESVVSFLKDKLT